MLSHAVIMMMIISIAEAYKFVSFRLRRKNKDLKEKKINKEKETLPGPAIGLLVVVVGVVCLVCMCCRTAVAGKGKTPNSIANGRVCRLGGWLAAIV